MALTLSWVPRNRDLQADLLVDHFAAGTIAPAGWAVVVEWRFRAASGDPWGAPTVQTVAPPALSTAYTPPADGFVQVTCYAIEGGLASWQGYVAEFPVAGGAPITPLPYVDQASQGYVDELANQYEDH